MRSLPLSSGSIQRPSRKGKYLLSVDKNVCSNMTMGVLPMPITAME